jgi:Ca2+/Na+ antiporter
MDWVFNDGKRETFQVRTLLLLLSSLLLLLLLLFYVPYILRFYNKMGNIFFLFLCVCAFFCNSIGKRNHNLESDDEEPHESSPLQPSEGDSKVTGLVTSVDSNNNHATHHNDEDEEATTAATSETWKLNLILAFLASWYAMILTGWGAVGHSGNKANPTGSMVSMWIVIGSQWLVFAFYIWSTVAPRLFPDRDFS